MVIGFQTKAQAESHRDGVLETLGDGWRGRVSGDAAGYTVSWVNGAVSLHYKYENATYWGLVGPVNLPGCGEPLLTPAEIVHKDDPIEAILEAIRYAQTKFHEIYTPMNLSMSVVFLNLYSRDSRRGV
jgi:hypothetical protein